MAAQSGLVTRFAPSPTGRLHLGHAYSALLASDVARAAGGRFLLRIEDIDQQRCQPEHERRILADLAWLKIDYERPVRRQSEHLQDYRDALDRLMRQGVLYRCFRTRREILEGIARAPHAVDSSPRTAPLTAADEAERLSAGAPFAWRLSLARAKDRLGAVYDRLTFEEAQDLPSRNMSLFETLPASPDPTGDVVLARKDLGVSYHLAVVVDDALQGVTHVIRGEDLRAATPVQRLLQTLLALPAPRYGHHPLLVDEAGRRLAKRIGSKSLEDLRNAGVTGDAVREQLGFAPA
jgi:glutamyl-Q tRNA(Asp) synthetase